MDKNLLLKQIDESYYSFDRSTFDSKQLDKISQKFTHIGPLPVNAKLDQFPNIMVPCSDSQAPYCKGKKIIITKEKLREIIDIFSQLIKSERMYKYLSYKVFIQNTRDFFEFESRPDENITIEISSFGDL